MSRAGFEPCINAALNRRIDGQKNVEVSSSGVVILDCNSHFVSFDQGDLKRSVPLEWIELAFDHRNGRLAICVQAVAARLGAWRSLPSCGLSVLASNAQEHYGL